MSVLSNLFIQSWQSITPLTLTIFHPQRLQPKHLLKELQKSRATTVHVHHGCLSSWQGLEKEKAVPRRWF
jgi:Lhr-like helicase